MENNLDLIQDIQSSLSQMQKNLAQKTSVVSSRKAVLGPFYEHLSKLNILQDLTLHRSLLQEQIQTDHLNIRRMTSQAIESVPLKFNSIQHYTELWQKLFYQQVKSHIYKQSKQEIKDAEPVDIVEVKECLDHSGSGFKIFVFNRLASTAIQKSNFNTGTLVVLSPVKPQKGSNYTHIVGFVEGGEQLAIKVLFDESIRKRSEQQWQQMTTTKRWYIQQVCSINTLERQYYALANMNKISNNLLQIMLQPQEHTKQAEKKFTIPSKLDEKLKITFNQSQYKAINSSLRQTGITLIQGPPGTGKTKTVLGTLSVLLSSYKKSQQQEYQPLMFNWRKSSQVPRDKDRLLNPWLYHGYTDWRDAPYIQNQQDPLNLTGYYVRCDVTDRKIMLNKRQEQVQLPQKVIICGPSNASVDEIIRKLLKEQLYDGTGLSYIPNFVRIGEHYDASLKQYSLDYLAQRLAEKQRGTDLNYYRSRVLNECRLVFATLSAAGNQIMQTSNIKFDTVVIDQAGQSIQISNIIPLLYGCQRLILIGDPNQLPATVFSQKSLEHKYDQSLFQRLMKSEYPVNILKTQYRMHPDISSVIGTNFYGHKLVDWDHLIAEQPKTTPSAFIIFHVDQAPESAYQRSYRNITQAKAVKDFALYLTKYYQDIGIVSPYSQQVSYIQSLVGKNKKCEVKTIDSFQGRQKQVIIFSAVRSNYVTRNKKIVENRRKTIGFVSDLRRINVSLSRAKNLCVIFGDIKRLSINSTWKNIIQTAIANNQVYAFSNRKNYFHTFKEDPKKMIIRSLD